MPPSVWSSRGCTTWVGRRSSRHRTERRPQASNTRIGTWPRSPRAQPWSSGTGSIGAAPGRTAGSGGPPPHPAPSAWRSSRGPCPGSAPPPPRCAGLGRCGRGSREAGPGCCPTSSAWCPGWRGRTAPSRSCGSIEGGSPSRRDEGRRCSALRRSDEDAQPGRGSARRSGGPAGGRRRSAQGSWRRFPHRRTTLHPPVPCRRSPPPTWGWR